MHLGSDPATVNDEVLCFVMVKTVVYLRELDLTAGTLADRSTPGIYSQR